MLTMKAFEKKYHACFTLNHTGKMQGMISLSTSVLLNSNCQRYAKIKGSICEKCYATRMSKAYKGLEKKLAINTEVLTSVLIPVEDLPAINSIYCRFEAFGDLNNEVQFANYANIARYNPRCTFALWTKSPHIIKKAVEAFGVEIPKNLVIIVSSLMLNEKRNVSCFNFVDKVFTVYDKKTADTRDINCGARNCFSCGRCYSKETETEISERVK